MRQVHHKRKRISGAAMCQRLVSYSKCLHRARDRDEVYRVLSEHAASIVGAYVALVFTRQQYTLRPERPARPEIPTERLWIVGEVGSLTPVVATARHPAVQPGGELESFRDLLQGPQFSCAVVAPLGSDAAVVLLERRRDRTFGPEDSFLLQRLCEDARAALLGALARWGAGVMSGEEERQIWVESVLRYARFLAHGAAPVSVAVLRLTAAAQAHEPSMLGAEEWFATEGLAQLRRSAPGVIATPLDASSFLVVFPETNLRQAREAVEKMRNRLEKDAVVEYGVTQVASNMASTLDVLNAARQNLQPMVSR